MIPAENTPLEIASLTHPGMSGKENEDRFGVSTYRLGEAQPVPVTLAIVCDGIGGHLAGEIAAELAVKTISQEVAAFTGADPIPTLRAAIARASQAIRDQAESNARQQGMGATCVCALVIENRLYLANLGDSRLYLVRQGNIRQLSTDHTWVQQAIELGILTPEQARNHPNAHVIRRYLGSPQPQEADFGAHLKDQDLTKPGKADYGLILEPEDQILLCTDGLTDLVEDQEILASLTSNEAQPALDQLINLANQRGGHDNITAVLLRVPESPTQTPAQRLAPANYQLRTVLIIFLLLAWLVAAALGWWALRIYGIIP